MSSNDDDEDQRRLSNSVTINRINSEDFQESSIEEVEQLVSKTPTEQPKKSILKPESESSLSNVLIQNFDPNMFDKFEVRLVFLE